MVNFCNFVIASSCARARAAIGGFPLLSAREEERGSSILTIALCLLLCFESGAASLVPRLILHLLVVAAATFALQDIAPARERDRESKGSCLERSLSVDIYVYEARKNYILQCSLRTGL